MHSMITRSKKNSQPPSDIDDQGNLVDLIDYDCNEPIDKQLLYEEISRLSKGNIKMNLSPKKTIKKKQKSKIIIEEIDKQEHSPKHLKRKKNKLVKSKSKTDLGGMLMTYILAKANKQIKKPKKKKLIKINYKPIDTESDVDESECDSDIDESECESNIYDSEYESDINDSDMDESDMDESYEDAVDIDELTDKTTTTEDSDIELTDEEETSSNELEESEEESEYDSDDEEYSELVEKYMSDNTEDGNLNYFHSLESNKKKQYIEEIKNVYSLSTTNIPLKFKVLNSDMDLYTKSLAINNLDKLSEMDISTGEYNKMDQWIHGLIKLPFGKVTDLPVKNDDEFEKKRNYIQSVLQNMDKAIYGHQEAKTHILQVIGKWIRNPESLGNVLAIQGPMGNGKTTLIKNGIAKSLDRPFEFVALGGASDSAFFEGHSYTYEGSRWGRIVDILHKCGSMNPIICFDELDKVSDTPKGDEIINMLIHMTDSSQNSKFQDNYFPGIDIDLSKVLFIFSFNDESKINRILKDRMYVIRTKGYKMKDKLQISHNYLLPEIYDLFNYTKEDITFNDEVLQEIIQTYTGGEEGVRNLKRCLENIISTLNIYHLTKSEDKEDIIDMKIKDFKLPITLTKDHIKELLKITSGDKPPEHMYL